MSTEPAKHLDFEYRTYLPSNPLTKGDIFISAMDPDSVLFFPWANHVGAFIWEEAVAVSVSFAATQDILGIIVLAKFMLLVGFSLAWSSTSIIQRIVSLAVVASRHDTDLLAGYLQD